MNKKKVYDVIGVGIGPANLGLAALLENIKDLNSVFLDEKKEFIWHNGVLLTHSNLQVHYLKDLVTLADPTNHYSFLSFLSSKNRLYQFINLQKSTIGRMEFEQYYKWVSTKLRSLKFSNKVTTVKYENNVFKVISNDSTYYTKNIILGLGKRPYIPTSAIPYLSSDVIPSMNFSNAKEMENQTVTIIGGGQSAAEIIYTLLTNNILPKQINWITNKHRFFPLEDSCFSNEFPTPSYCSYFYNKDSLLKDRLNNLLFDTNNGITMELLNEIYRKIYDLKFIEKKVFKMNIFTSHSYEDMKKNTDGYIIDIKDIESNTIKKIRTDKIIFATGFKSNNFDILNSIIGTKKYEIAPDFSVRWEHDNTNKIYVQNSAENYFGLGDTNLGIFPWRNSVIINSLLNKTYYDVADTSLLLS